MFNLVNRAKKKNNKGFSLVELIVVVLIIAIIAVALAPQVMKYVGKARTGTDANNAATIKSAASTAITDYINDGGTTSFAAVTYKVESNGLTTTGTDPADANGTGTLKTHIETIMGKDFPTPNAGGNFYIKVAANGARVAVETSDGAIS